MAKIDRVISKVERWRGQRSQYNFLVHLRSIVWQGDEDVMLGVIHFLRTLPLELGFDGQRAFEQKLDEMTSQYVVSNRAPASKRLDAVKRCILWTSEGSGVSQGLNTPDLRKHVWLLLLQLASENMEAAVRLIDEYWDRQRPPHLFMSLDLHHTPELAYRLAVKFKPLRLEFAASMLRESISRASFQLRKLEPPAVVALEKVMDASCRLLADWVIEFSQTHLQSALYSLDHLLRFGTQMMSIGKGVHINAWAS